LNNKLLCSFILREQLQTFITGITSDYNIEKIFVLTTDNSDEYVCTYGLDMFNTSVIPDNTIMVHRKKDTNTLYTINALNTLIMSINNGVLNTKYVINWNDYKNNILLIRDSKFTKVNTKLFTIFS